MDQVLPFGLPLAALQNCPLPNSSTSFLYGTAGFRGLGDDLSHVAYLSGILFACLGRGCAGETETLSFGTMITASHNPAEQNGLKLVNDKGAMIVEQWEEYFFQFVNAHVLDNLGADSEKKALGNVSLIHLLESPSASSGSLPSNLATDTTSASPPTENKKQQEPSVRQIELASCYASALSAIEKHALESNEIRLPYASSVRIIIGKDTRPSSPGLQKMFAKGAEAAGADVLDLGVVSTPQLYFLVERANILQLLRDSINEQLYSSFFQNQFHMFFKRLNFIKETAPRDLKSLTTSSIPTPATLNTHELSTPTCKDPSLKNGPNVSQAATNNNGVFLFVDGSNGVGGMKLHAFTQIIQKCTNSLVLFQNEGNKPDDILNEGCGADFVEKMKTYPKNFESISFYQKCVSVDGDGDRLVYFTSKPSLSTDKEIPDREFVLLNGQRILALFAMVILKLLEAITQELIPKEEKTVLKIGILHTAYANGNGIKFITQFFENLSSFSLHFQLEMVCLKTGVKNFNRKSGQYDICLMYEANGHGTVTTKFDVLLKWATERNIQEKDNYTLLAAFLSLFNQAIGDACTNALAVEAALCYLNFSMADWIDLYEDLPVVQKAISLPRAQLNKLQTEPETESRLLEPKALQDRLDFFIFTSHDPNARAFVRASGTEEMCRIYCEASTLPCALHLLHCIEEEIHTFLASPP